MNRELVVLSHLLNQAMQWKWIKAKSARIKRYKENNSRIVYLTDDQCLRQLDAAAADPTKMCMPSCWWRSTLEFDMLKS